MITVGARFFALPGAAWLALLFLLSTSGCSTSSGKKTTPQKAAAVEPSASPSVVPEPAQAKATAAAVPTPEATPDALVVRTAPQPEVPHQTVAHIVASVDGEPITARDVEQFSAAVGHPVKAENLASNEDAKAALKALISQKLIEKELDHYSSKVEEEQVDNYVDSVRREKHLTPEQFKAALEQSGLSMDDYRKHAREDLEKAMMVKQQVREKVDISPTDIQAFYDEHKADFTVTNERLKIAQILVGVPQNASPQQVAQLQAKADQIRKQAASGVDFGDLARKYSDDVSRNNGGELGWFGPQDIMDQVYNAVKNLKRGEVSQVVRTDHGFHILKLEDHEVPGVKPLAQVKSDIREVLTNERANAQLEKWVETDLVKQHDVETFY